MPEQVRKTQWRWLLLFLGVFLLVGVLVFDPKLDTGGDNAVYIILAESLRAGQGYTNLYLPEAPAHTQYPPGFPFLLAGLFLLTRGVSVVAAKVLVLLTGLGAMFFTWRLLELLFRDRARAVMAFMVFLPMLAIASSRVLTEMPFLCVSIAAVYLLARAEREDRAWQWWTGIALANLGIMLRTFGIALVVAVAVFLLYRRRFRLFGASLLLFVIVFVSWQVRNAQVGTGLGYWDFVLAKDPYVLEFGRITVADMAVRLGNNLVGYLFTVLPTGLVPLLRPGIGAWLVGLMLLVLLKLGFWSTRPRLSAVTLYPVIGFLVLLCWPEVWRGERFILPLVPLLVGFVFLGLVRIEKSLKRRVLVPAVAAVLVVVNAGGVVILARDRIRENLAFLRGDRFAGYSPGWRRYLQAVEWLRANTPPDRVVLARKPEFVYLMSGHRSICYPFTNDRARVQAAIDRCDYIILEDFTWTETAKHFLIPVLHQDPDRYRTVHATGPPETFVLEVAGR